MAQGPEAGKGIPNPHENPGQQLSSQIASAINRRVGSEVNVTVVYGALPTATPATGEATGQLFSPTRHIICLASPDGSTGVMAYSQTLKSSAGPMSTRFVVEAVTGINSPTPHHFLFSGDRDEGANHFSPEPFGAEKIISPTEAASFMERGGLGYHPDNPVTIDAFGLIDVARASRGQTVPQPQAPTPQIPNSTDTLATILGLVEHTPASLDMLRKAEAHMQPDPQNDQTGIVSVTLNQP